MALLKTKDVARELGVSQTTILRWVRTDPSSARRDRLGHFVFGDPEIAALRRIQASIQASFHENGNPAQVEQSEAKLRHEDGGGAAAGIADPAAAAADALHAADIDADAADAPAHALPVAADAAAAPAAPSSSSPGAEATLSDKSSASEFPSMQDNTPDELFERIGRLELSLARKADEVVSVQLLEHRRELEEIRSTLKQLAASIENMKSAGKEASALPVTPLFPAEIDQRPKKRRLFRAIFPF